MSQAAPGYVLWCQTPPTRSPRSKTVTFSYPARCSMTTAPTPPKPPPTTAIARARPRLPSRPFVRGTELTSRSLRHATRASSGTDSAGASGGEELEQVADPPAAGDPVGQGKLAADGVAVAPPVAFSSEISGFVELADD